MTRTLTLLFLLVPAAAFAQNQLWVQVTVNRPLVFDYDPGPMNPGPLGRPDLLVCVSAPGYRVCADPDGGEGRGAGFFPNDCGDSFLCISTFTGLPDVNSVTIEVSDEDLRNDDPIGTGTCAVNTSCDFDWGSVDLRLN